MNGTVQYAADRSVVACLLGLAALFAVLAYVESTVPGRLLLGVAALGCAVEGVRCALVRPVVSATSDGLVVVPGIRPITLAWSGLERIGARVDRRRGSIARSLELDVGETVFVVPAYRLGAPVAEVVSALEAARPR